ncbi:hypothetical protein D6817_03185 [Candidatus Pacearchaeota archaeon]|nr:MAG: hypothetical protein D6817_03185 [Candidatus Pacearchaeota archaeon]
MKVLIFDSGVLINFALNGFLEVLPKLRSVGDVRFAITDEVLRESVSRPINIPRFELGALRIEALVESGVLEMPPAFGVPLQELRKLTQNFMNTANQLISANGKWVRIVSDGEMSCLALSRILSSQGVENLIAIDERTTRILTEKPENLIKLMEKRIHKRVKLDRTKLSEFQGFRFVRSTELVFLAYKKGLLDVKGKKALEAALYATKYKGAAISFEEIDEIKRIAKSLK